MTSPSYLDKLIVDLTKDDCPVCVESFLGSPSSPSRLHDDDPSSGIALVRCGHAFHDHCLKQWLPKANSCPICRKKINLVEILDKVGGVLVSTYKVKNKRQVAEFDAATWAAENPEYEYVDEDEYFVDPHLCPRCHQYAIDWVECYDCETHYHPWCAGLEEAPIGDWYCQVCRPPAPPSPVRPQRTQGRSREAYRQRPRTEERGHDEQRGRPSAGQNRLSARQNRPGWANISNRIHTVTGLELDFLDNDPSMANFRQLQNRASEERRELTEWEERLNSANRRITTSMAGSSRSRPNLVLPAQARAEEARSHRNSDLHHLSATRAVREVVSDREQSAVLERTAQSSPEQVIAWGDFDRAQHLDTTASESRKRKAESSVGSPVELAEHQEPERRLKRPRTRAVPDNGTSLSTPSNQTPGRPAINTHNEPSFLASLLREVESATGEERLHWSPSVSVQESATSPSTYHTSPATSPSPVSSNYHTPRALSLTPPPQQNTRTASAQSMSSRSRSPLSIPVRQHAIQSTPQTLEIRQPRPRRQDRFVGSRSLEISPVRTTMPTEAKESINRMVKTALSPHWRSSKLSKDQYAEVNCNVSRIMYEIVADDYANLEKDRQTWETIAAQEVATAVNALAA